MPEGTEAATGCSRQVDESMLLWPNMDRLRGVYTTVLMSLVLLAGCFGTTPVGPATGDDVDEIPNSPPVVTSAVVRLDVRDRPAVDVSDEGIFFDVVRAGFSARRKQLHNALAQGLGADRAAVARLLADAGIESMRRAQTLSLEEWARISELWGEQSSLGSPGLR